MIDITTWSLNRCISVYLTHSYIYYKLDKNIIDDYTFDAICKRLYRECDAVEASTHQHKHLLNKESLAAGSGYDLPFNKFPQIIIFTALTLTDRCGIDGKEVVREDWFK